jgi:hypothetical protein
MFPQAHNSYTVLHKVVLLEDIASMFLWEKFLQKWNIGTSVLVGTY